jgi:hypothetical protein
MLNASLSILLVLLRTAGVWEPFTAADCSTLHSNVEGRKYCQTSTTRTHTTYYQAYAQIISIAE